MPDTRPAAQWLSWATWTAHPACVCPPQALSSRGKGRRRPIKAAPLHSPTTQGAAFSHLQPCRERQASWYLPSSFHPGYCLNSLEPPEGKCPGHQSKLEGKIGLPRANPRGRLRSPSELENAAATRLRLTSIESVMPSSHLILCCPLLLLPLIPPSIRVFYNERRSSSSAPRRGSAEPRPRGCSGLGEPRPALPSF